MLFIAACLEHFLGCQNKSKILDYGHACYVSASFAHQATTDHGDRIRLKPEMLGKPCLFQYLEQKLNTGVSIFLQRRDETTMTGDRIFQ